MPGEGCVYIQFELSESNKGKKEKNYVEMQ